MTSNPALSIEDIESATSDLDILFLDKKYANKIPTFAIPFVLANILPNLQVKFYLHSDLNGTIKDNKGNFYGDQNITTLTTQPIPENLEIYFSTTKETQFKLTATALKQGGLVIPLTHTNTLYSQTSPSSDKLLHHIVLAGWGDTTNTIKIIDPSPGFSNIADYGNKKDGLKIRAGCLNYQKAQLVAGKLHPYGSVLFNLPISTYEKAHRSITTIITS
jgi:hypothetical protein